MHVNTIGEQESPTFSYEIWCLKNNAQGRKTKLNVATF